MKTKLLSLALAITTLLSLTACGSDKSKTPNTEREPAPESSVVEPSSVQSSEIEHSENETSDMEPVTPEVPEENLFPFAGTWRLIQRDADSVNEYFVITKFGDATKHYIDYEGKPCTYEYALSDKDEIVLGEENSLYFKNKNGRGSGETIYFTPVGDHYGMKIYKSSSYNYYYREEDMADYDVVELTSENIGKYLKGSNSFTYDKDDYGDVTKIYVRDYLEFKDGLGAASFFVGELYINYNYANATVNLETDEITYGEIYKTDVAENTKKEKFCALGDYLYNHLSWGADFTDNGDGTYNVESVCVMEVTGAEKIFGKVYVPKGWNG